jgi:non-specific serine/threonine protein kinase
MTSLIGQTVSHYKILEHLGSGGMGVVYKAEDTKLKRTVALKFLPSALLAGDEEKKRFLVEAQASAALSHPNIATVFEIDESEAKTFIALEYIEGQNLAEKVKSGPLKLEDAISIGIQASEGLQAAHEKGIVHRDIKSQNIMVTPRGQVKILDFGLAKLRGSSFVTRVGTTVGTMGYMSPEQLRGDPVDHRTDIWALGVVLYELVSGRKPFQGDYEEAVAYQVLNAQPELLTAIRTGVPVELERIVDKTLQKDRTKRYQHIDELHVDLQSLQRETGSGKLKQQSTGSAGLSRKLPYLYGGIAACLVFLIAGILLLPRIANKEKVEPTPRGDQTQSASEIKRPNSIAVLPFKNISSDKEQEYFCDGMTEAIITDLSQLGQLIVMSPSAVFHYKGEPFDYRKIRDELQVRHVLEGSIQRSGHEIRVSVQLTNAETGVQLWAERFDRPMRDVFSIQDDISRKIIDVLKLALSTVDQRQFEGHPTENLEAYDLYLRGRYHYNRRNIKDANIAIPLLERATSIDPRFAEAFAVLGSTYTQKAFFDQPLKKEWEEKAFVSVEKALSIIPNLAEAYVAKGNLLWTSANHFPHEKAIMAYRRAIELKPSYDGAHEMLGFVYYHVGLLEEGLTESRRALQINPGSAYAQRQTGIALLYLGRYDEALTELQKVPAGVNPQVVPTQIAIALFYLGRRKEAKELLQDVAKEMPGDPFLLSAQAMMLAAEGERAEALGKIRLATKRENTYLGHFHHAAYNLGSAYALMKNSVDAVKWLRKAIEGGFPCYPVYERDPNLNSLRQDPEFESLMNDLKKMWESYKTLR